MDPYEEKGSAMVMTRVGKTFARFGQLIKISVIPLSLFVCVSLVFAQTAETPDEDPALLRRLKVVKTFETRKGDTFGGIAMIVYGHRNWGGMIKDLNPTLQQYAVEKPLPIGTRVSYKAPYMGSNYEVQPGDILIRIAIWKYDDHTAWKVLHQKNKDIISNPNLIHPGDHLLLGEQGQMANQTTGEVITGNTQLAGQSAQDQAASSQNPASGGVRDPATFSQFADPLNPPAPHFTDDPQAWALYWANENPYFASGFLAGLLLLMWVPVSWLIARNRRRHALIDGDVPFRFVQPEPEFEDEPENTGPSSTLYQFKKRPLEEYKVDKSLIHFEDGEVDRRPGYHSLVPAKLRKYLKRRPKG